MLTIMLLASELPIIIVGAAVAAYVAVDHQARADEHEQELRDIDEWLEQMWSA